MSKQYGLIIPNKNKKLGEVKLTRPSIFNEDSDSDTPKLSKPTGLARARKQDKINQDKALVEDPTVYQYDEVYDKIEQEKVESKLARKDIDKKPKYISKLLASAERRKRENERRVERQVQKEREEEGEQFKDKESFVTSAYKKKLEELKALEEQEKREEYLEAIGDVTKQGNLDGFYRHLYDQKVNYEDKIKCEEDTGEKEIKKEKSDDENSEKERNKRKKSSSSESDTPVNENNDRKIKKNRGVKKRKYRSRRDSKDANSDSEVEKEIKKEHLPSNLDADSDFSIDSSSDDESVKENKNKDKNDKIEHEGEKLQLPEKGNVLSDNVALAKKNEDKDEKHKNEDKSAEKEEQKELKVDNQEEVKPKKPKIDIWKKRTVGTVFDEALKRYFERKAARDAERNV